MYQREFAVNAAELPMGALIQIDTSVSYAYAMAHRRNYQKIHAYFVIEAIGLLLLHYSYFIRTIAAFSLQSYFRSTTPDLKTNEVVAV